MKVYRRARSDTHADREEIVDEIDLKGDTKPWTGSKHSTVNISRDATNRQAIATISLDENEVVALHAGLIQGWRTSLRALEIVIGKQESALAKIHKIAWTGSDDAAAACTAIAKIAWKNMSDLQQIQASADNKSTRPAKRKPNAAFMKSMTPSAALAVIVGSSPMPRTEVTKRIWDYIKRNKLQDGVNRRLINADAQLKKIFGGKDKVSMFEMTKLVSNHLK